MGVMVRNAALGMAYLLLVAGCVAESGRAVSQDDLKSGERGPGKLGQMQDCMEAAGWEVEYRGGVLYGPNLPQQQMSLYDEDDAQCAEGTHFFDPLTAEDYRRLYPLEVAHHQCLLDHGYDSIDPPSEQQFVDDWLSQSPDRDPYQANSLIFLSGNRDDYWAATQVCQPPLWGF